MSRARLYDSWQELLRTASCGDRGQDGVDVAVEAIAARVDSGVGLFWKLDEQGANAVKTQVAFDDPSAEVRTIHFDLRVQRVIGQSATIAPGDTLEVGLAVSPDVSVEEAKEDLESETPFLYFLESSPVFDYSDQPRMGISEDGLLIAVSDGEGHLSFPALDPEDAIQPPQGTILEDARPLDCVRTSG